MTRLLSAWRRVYGENPMHLLALLGTLALAGTAVVHAARSPAPTPLLLAVWFAGAVIAHDLLLFPLYALADRALTLPRFRAVNYVRVPVLGSGLLLLVSFPPILGQGEDAYVAASGLDTDPYLGRWLAITACMFGLAAVLYLARLVRSRRTDPHRGR